MQQTEVYTYLEIGAAAISVEKAQPNLTSPQAAFTNTLRRLLWSWTSAIHKTSDKRASIPDCFSLMTC